MPRKRLTITGLVAAFVFSTAVPPPLRSAAADVADNGRFVWRDLMATDVEASKRFYAGLFGWSFENTRRGDRPYVLARLDGEPVAGIVDVSAISGAAPQWISFMSVSDVDQATRLVADNGGTVLLEPRDVPTVARAAVVADPQGAPLGLAELKRTIPDTLERQPQRFFWQEYLARDAAKALAFYTRIAGYEAAISDTRLGVEYHLLRTSSRPRAGLFELPATASDVLPNWLPYVLVDDAAGLAQRVAGLGGRILVPADPGTTKRLAGGYRRSWWSGAGASEVSVLTDMRTSLLIAVVVLFALLSAACVDGSGMGVGVGAPARWGGGGGTPPVFVGGPA